jgi:head-tail adaptor
MTTIGQLTERVTIWEPVFTTNPETGGQVPGDPRLIATVRGSLVPMSATEALSTMGRALQQDLGVINTATHVLTLWFRPDVTVGQFVEYDDPKRETVRHFEITQVASPAERGVWLVLGCVERVQ